MSEDGNQLCTVHRVTSQMASVKAVLWPWISQSIMSYDQGQVQFPLSGQCPKRPETAGEVFFFLKKKSNSIEGYK